MVAAADHTSLPRALHLVTTQLCEDESEDCVTLIIAGPGSSPVMGQSGGLDDGGISSTFIIRTNLESSSEGHGNNGSGTAYDAACCVTPWVKTVALNHSGFPWHNMKIVGLS